jgi:O-methyltransferase
MGGPWICQSLYVAAKLGVADHLRDGPLTVDALAARTDSHTDALHRFCRVLAALDVLTSGPERSFGLGRLGLPLLTDVPDSVRHGFILQGEEVFRAWTEVLHTVRTGRPAFDRVYGMDYFEYLAKNPDASLRFSQAMGDLDAPPAVLDEYDFSGCSTVVDLGGGAGTVLADVLRRRPSARGVLLELPNCVDAARSHLDRLGVGGRAEVVGGDFFASVPAGGDLYLLSRVLHNWDDTDALRLLRRVRGAMTGDARLVVIDHLLPDQEGFHPGLLADLHMLVVLGSRERTEHELRALLETAGLRVRRVINGDVGTDPRAQCAIEAVAAGEPVGNGA